MSLSLSHTHTLHLSVVYSSLLPKGRVVTKTRMEPSNKPRRGRKTASCIECKRRKQKCDRLWPCNNCQTRRAAHLCQFGDLHSTRNDEPPPKKKKIDSINEYTSESEQQDVINQQPEPDAASALKVLGYLKHDIFQAISSPVLTLPCSLIVSRPAISSS
ncbi:hypothetical protein V2W45_162913 [Cenococcum geophilum]